MVWDRNEPTGAREVSAVDNYLRDNQAALETALDAEHSFATGGTQTGEHREGSAVCWRGLDADIGLVTPREGMLYFASDTRRLYIGNDATPCAWQAEAPRRNVHRGGTINAVDRALPEEAAWAIVPGFTTTSFALSGDTGATSDLLITLRMVVRCDTDDGIIAFTLWIDGAAVTAAGNGLAVAPHVDASDTNEQSVMISLTWLHTAVVKAGAGTIDIEPRYQCTAGASGVVVAGFSTSINIIEL